MGQDVLLEVGAGSGEILYRGPSQYTKTDQAWILRYTDAEKVENRVRFTKSSCLVRRKGEDEVRVHLSLGGESYVEVESQMGILRLAAVPEVIFAQQEYMEIRYRLKEAPQGTFRFYWKITEHLS